MIYGRIDETRVGRGVERNEGVGCSGKGVPDRSSPFVKMGGQSEESSLTDDFHSILGGGFPVDLTEEEDLGFPGPTPK